MVVNFVTVPGRWSRSRGGRTSGVETVQYPSVLRYSGLKQGVVAHEGGLSKGGLLYKDVRNPALRNNSSLACGVICFAALVKNILGGIFPWRLCIHFYERVCFAVIASLYPPSPSQQIFLPQSFVNSW